MCLFEGHALLDARSAVARGVLLNAHPSRASGLHMPRRHARAGDVYALLDIRCAHLGGARSSTRDHASSLSTLLGALYWMQMLIAFV